jgi:GT2 family glycosyltransferase
VQAANVGLQMSAGDVFTRTDDDVLPSPGWLQAIAESFASSERIGGVTGPTIIPEEYRQGRDIIRFNEKVKARSNVMWKLLAEVYHGYLMEGQPFAVSRFFKSGAFSLGSNYPECLQLRKSIEVDHLEACNWSARRELIERVGGFDEEYVGVGEYHEADIAYKIKRLGYQLIFNPKAKVEHCPSISGVFSARAQAFGRSRNLVLFYFRHIKPDTPDKLLRFLTYLLFYNGYWLFKFLTTGNANQLTGLVGTVVALFKFAPESRKQ